MEQPPVAAPEAAAEGLQLLHLPPEILHHILGNIDDKDLIATAATCHFFRDYVMGNLSLCREVYLNILDAPPPDQKGIDWETEFWDYVKLQRIAARPEETDKMDELPFVYNTITRLLHRASPIPNVRLRRYSPFAQSHNASFLRKLFRNRTNVDAFLTRSRLFDRARREVPVRRGFRAGLRRRPTGEASAGLTPLEPATEHHRQSAHLHCLYGMPVQHWGRTRSSRTYPFAVSKVYDLRQYNEKNVWGPFLDDGSMRVDWEKVEAILMVIGHNMKQKGLAGRAFNGAFFMPWVGSWRGSYNAVPRSPLTPLDERDPYNVTGMWLRIVCFLDYNDFFEYNFAAGGHLPPNVPRPPLDVGEATRLILMRMQVTKIEAPGPDDGQELPIVHFKGVARAIDSTGDPNANSDLLGTVRLTKEGEVRWTTYSLFGGEARWRSEGIQLGGVSSSRGVVGNWFDVDFDPHGPVGPTTFWKIAQLQEPIDDGAPASIADMISVIHSMDLDVDDPGDEEEWEPGFEDDDSSDTTSDLVPAEAMAELERLLGPGFAEALANGLGQIGNFGFLQVQIIPPGQNSGDQNEGAQGGDGGDGNEGNGGEGSTAPGATFTLSLTPGASEGIQATVQLVGQGHVPVESQVGSSSNESEEQQSSSNNGG